MSSRLQRSLSLHTLLFYAEVFASYYIIFAVALPFYPVPLAWLIAVGLTALTYLSPTAARGLLTVLTLPAAVYVLGPLGFLVWVLLIASSRQPTLFSTSLALLAATPLHDLGFAVALARYAFGLKVLASFIITQILLMMAAATVAEYYVPLSGCIPLRSAALDKLDMSILVDVFSSRVASWSRLDWYAAGAYLIDPRTYAFIIMVAAAAAAARTVHIRAFPVLERRREFAGYGGMPARMFCPILAWIAAVAIVYISGWVYEFMGGGWGIGTWNVLTALPIALLYSVALGSPLARYKLEAPQPTAEREEAAEKGRVKLPSLEDVYDMEPVKARLREIIEIVRRGRRAYGIILFGPPGTGKSYMARALAGELNWPFFEVKVEEIVTMWYGESERNLAALLDEVERKVPAVLLIDEMEQIALARTRRFFIHEATLRLVDILLRRLQEFHDKKVPVLIVGATNVPEEVDPAFLRPGRFDEVVYVPLPDVKGRRELWEAFIRKAFGEVEVNVEELAKLSERYTPAEIEHIVEKVRERVKSGKPALDDFVQLLNEYKPRLKLSDLRRYEELARKYSATRVEVKPAMVAEVRWEDIGDLEEVKRELRLTVEGPLKHRELAEKLGVKLPKGILLYGPPGTGKTTLVKALANELNVSFITITGDELSRVGPYSAPQLIREKFDLARENAPAILFIDEVEVIARAREVSEWRNALSQLLQEMDGLEAAQGVIVIGATNKPWELDVAILRPGRFDKLVYVPPPDKEGRKSVLKVLLRGLNVSEDVIERLAAESEYYTPAELKAITDKIRGLLFEEALQTGSARTAVTWDDVERARRGVRPRLDPKQLFLYEEFKRRFSG